MNLAEFGKRIKLQREKKRLTQAQLANSLQITAQAVSKWERGENAPDIGLLKSLSIILGISIDWLLTAEDKLEDTFEATVFCTSLRNYANKSTLLSPRDITLWINGIFHVLTTSVLSEGGVPIKYVGDGFLAYFSQTDHARRAYNTAIGIWKTFENKNLLITLNCGKIYLGVIGHSEYSHPDIMGNTVNTAFFMNQWCTKTYNFDSELKGNIYVSNTVFEQLKHTIKWEEWTKVTKEKSKLTVDIYKVL